MEITLSSGNKVEISEMKFVEALEKVGDKNKPVKEVSMEMIKLATSLTEEEINNLSFKDGKEILMAINKVNGMEMPEDFMNSKE